MKKIIPLLMALAMVMSLSVTAFASELGGSHDVKAYYEKTETEDPIYSVDLNWGEPVFTYKETFRKTWNPESHTYDTESTGGKWDKTESSIVVTNHSNVAVTVTMSLTPVEGTGVEVTLTGGNATLKAGEVGNVEGADSVTGVLTISGKPNDTVTEAGIKVGEVTVTIQ